MEAGRASEFLSAPLGQKPGIKLFCCAAFSDDLRSVGEMRPLRHHDAE
jgi:hypothetical protein